ncbi:MAG: hypothetical protein HGA90_01265, partial [Alphaproteobacteria bacterium]|nr:hypothetical protein [Alphaproteobacteria bacterium]
MKGGLAYEGKYLQAEYFGAFREDRLAGVVGYSWLNTVLVYAEEPECLPELVRAMVPSIQKRNGVVDAVLGLAPLADKVIEALKIPPTAFRQNDPDSLFRLPLEKLRLPNFPPGAQVRKAEEKDREQLIAWRIAFNIEAVNTAPGPELEKKVREEINNRLPLQELFVLEKGDMLLAMCGIGGHIPDTVIIGPVWTPVEWRGRGYGKAVTAGALKILAEERPQLRQVVLFAS